MNKKSVLLVTLGYVIWGLQPLYWGMMTEMSSMFILAFRILWGAVFLVVVLAATHRLKHLKALFLDKQKMKYLVPAAVFLLLDWGVFIYAVQVGRVLDTSLGYYMAPFVVFGIGMLVFKEKPSRLVLLAMGLALVGVVFNIVYNVANFGKFPLLAILLSFLFAIYGMLKRYAQADPVVSVAAETIMMTPLALLYLVVFQQNAMAASTITEHLLLAGAGVVTVLPMILYSLGVLKLPFVMLGFMQYISPTLGLLCGLLLGERFTVDKLITFIFIWAGLAIYLFATLQAERARAAREKAATLAGPSKPKG